LSFLLDKLKRKEIRKYIEKYLISITNNMAVYQKKLKELQNPLDSAQSFHK
jgi:hypothetical protein